MKKLRYYNILLRYYRLTISEKTSLSDLSYKKHKMESFNEIKETTHKIFKKLIVIPDL